MWTDKQVNQLLNRIEVEYNIKIENKEKPKRKSWLLRFNVEKRD